MTKFIVDGQEKELRYNVNGIDFSGDMIGNTYHGMDQDEDGRYIASQEDFEWWDTYLTKHEEMGTTIADYKERFGSDEVDRVVWSSMEGWDIGDQPDQVIDGLKEAFGELSKLNLIDEVRRAE